MTESPIILVTSRQHCSLVLVAAISLFALWPKHSCAQTYQPGSTYFGRSNYIEYATGDLPFIMSAPHGGSLTPAEIPDRTNCATCGWDFATATDSNTDDVAAKIRTELGNLTGHLPHIIICHIDRNKIDCNREVVEGAQGKAAAVTAWNEFFGFIDYASNNIVTNFGKGFYIDQHGQSHPEGRLELGYLADKYDLTNTDSYMDSHPSSFKNQSSIRTLANSVSSSNSFSKLLRGTNSFGEFMVGEGYPATPSFTTPAPFANPSSSTAFFNGGYNVSTHGSDGGGPLSAMQIEANYTGVRDTSANRTAYAQSLARTLEKYFILHYGINLRTCAPSVWDSAGGNWSGAGNWALGIAPVSSNYLVFAGSGGTTTNNLAALTTGMGVVSSITFGSAATGTYIITNNALTFVGGITNDNTFTNIIYNNLTLPANHPFAINSGALTLNGVISGAGGFTKSGAGTLTLTVINTYTGTTTNSAGTISLNATSTFSSNALLVLAGGDILALNSRSTAPLSNSILLTGNATIAGNSTLTNSNRILPFSADSVITTGGTLTIRNVGTNTFGTNNAFRVRFTGSGFNFSQPIVVGHASDLSVTISQLESYNDSGDQTFSGAISGTGQFRRDGANPAAGRTIFTGANTYAGGTFVNTGTLLVNNLSGSGTGTGNVTVSSGGTLGGNGTISGAVACTGAISPGQSAGVLTFVGGLDLSSGTNVWELSSLSDAGAGTNFDQIVLTGGNLTLGGTSKLKISFIDSAGAPTNTNPFWMMSHSWKIISLTGAATNSGAMKFTTVISNSYSTGTFINTTDASGSVLLSYVTPTPTKPVVQAFTTSASGVFNLTATAQTNRTYILQSTTNLVSPNWIAVSTNVAPANTLTISNISGSTPVKFFRLLAVP